MNFEINDPQLFETIKNIEDQCNEEIGRWGYGLFAQIVTNHGKLEIQIAVVDFLDSKPLKNILVNRKYKALEERMMFEAKQ